MVFFEINSKTLKVSLKGLFFGNIIWKNIFFNKFFKKTKILKKTKNAKMSLESTTQNIKNKTANLNADFGAKVKFNFTSGEGVVYVDATVNPAVVSNENIDADCTVLVELSDLDDMLSGSLNPMQAFMGGKMRIEGDMSIAMKLQGFFS